MKFKEEKFLVYGMGVSGQKAAEKLLSLGAEVFIHDDEKTALEGEAVEKLLSKGCKIYGGGDLPPIIILSPGVPIDSPLVVTAKRNGSSVIGEIELGWSLTLSPIIAVSGTNGKTTVSTIIHQALLLSGETSYLAGNIGAPLTDKPTFSKASEVTVAEISSFQLETVKSFKPHIGLMLNIKEDHLDRHYTMENYVFLKKRLFSNMGASEYAVLNYDDPIVRSFAPSLKCKVVWFSLNEKVDGAYLKDGAVYFGEEEILPLSALNISGLHNVENALAAVCALKSYGIKPELIRRALTSFKGINHRLNDLGEIDGVTYFNDSKATNADAAIKAVKTMTKPTVVILGGLDKGQSFSELFNAIKESKVYHAVLMGKAKYKLLDTAIEAGFESVSLANSFESAVSIAKLESKKGGAVLLSPACASFDMFEDFEARGLKFVELVKGVNE